MKKIAVLLDGGIANDGRVQRIVSSLSKNFKVDLYYCNPTINDKLIFESSNVELFSYSKKENWFVKNFYFHKKFQEIIDLIEVNNKKYDFIYCNDYPLLYTSVKIKNKIKSKLIYDSHEIYIETINQFFPVSGFKGLLYGKLFISLNKLIHRRIEYNNIRFIDCFITVCDSFLEYFQKKYNIKNHVVLKNCPDIYSEIINTNKIKKELNLDINSKVLLYQGVLNPGRGIEKILYAAKKFNNDIHFVVIGGGPQENHLKELTKKMNLNNVHFLGKKSFKQLLEYTASADLGILLIESINISKELTLPNKVFEYMVASIPFVTNQLPEGSKIVKEENCGYVINDSSAQLISDGINSIFKNIDMNLGHNGFMAIQKKYNWISQFDKVNIMINSL
jgi:glycosyltransferase involved in cell wall biosynthesis